ncbi:MAG: hypothetical protein ACK56I_30275 [bacterium]
MALEILDGLFDCLATSLQPILENISHRRQLHPTLGIHRILGCAATASPAADQPDLDDVAARRVRTAGKELRRYHPQRGPGGQPST